LDDPQRENRGATGQLACRAGFFDNLIEINSVFGGTKRKILSKDLKGGEINTVFGGNDIDLSQADINGTATFETNIVFGGVKLIVPAHWQIKSEVDCVFGTVEDKRRIRTCLLKIKRWY